MCDTPLRKMRRESHATPKVTRLRDFLQSGLATIWSVVLCLVLATSLQAQERVRTSASQLPIEAYQRSPEAFFYLGPFQEILTGSVAVQYTDNVDLTPT